MYNRNFLIFTNLFPYFNDTQGGSFITNRLMILKSLDIDFNVYALIPDDTYIVKLIKKYSGKKIYDNKKNNLELNGINYNYIKIHRNLLNVIKERTIREKIFLQYSNYILKILYDQIKNQNYNLIIAHGMYEPPAGLIAKIFSKKLNIPYVVICQGSYINYKMQLSPELYKDVFENAAKVIFVSNVLLNKAKLFGYSGSNSIVITNWMEPDLLKLLDREKINRELELNKEVIGFDGCLKIIKSLYVLVTEEYQKRLNMDVLYIIRFKKFLGHNSMIVFSQIVSSLLRICLEKLMYYRNIVKMICSSDKRYYIVWRGL
jgi:hypothetical protein